MGRSHRDGWHDAAALDGTTTTPRNARTERHANASGRAKAAKLARATLAAGFAYFVVVFAAGFFLGTVRVLVLAPGPGVTLATAIELPLMLLISWLACARLIRRFSVGPTWRQRVGMGACALALLVGAETLLGVIGFGRSLAEHMRSYHAPGPALGLAAQLLFAAFPSIQMLLKPDRGDGPGIESRTSRRQKPSP